MMPMLAAGSLLLAMYLPFCARVQDPVVTPAIELPGLWAAPVDVASRDLWAASLLSQLSERQWRDAFLAAGYSPASADPFIAAIRSRIAQAARAAADAPTLER